MEIRWNNVIAAALLLAGALVFVKNPEAIASFLSSMGRIGAGRDQTLRGLLAAGFCGVVLVAVVKLLTANERNR